MENSLIEARQRERSALLQALSEFVDGHEGARITPMQYIALGAQIGLPQDVTGRTVRFLVSEGLLEYKPASEAVGFTHKGIVEVERLSEASASYRRIARPESLAEGILRVLRSMPAKIQMEELKENLPEFSDVPDPDWYLAIDTLLSEGTIKAGVVRSGAQGAMGAAYNLEITQKGRALALADSAQNKLARDVFGESDDRRFARLAIEEARKSVPEDGRVHPKVGVVVVKDGRVLAMAHRGEFPQCHAEFIAMEKKLPDLSLAGATVYATLEPCTSRNHPKVPCAVRLTERKVARVVIGMLDPDDRISGRGQRTLRKAGIVTDFFDHDLMTEIEELNRDFMREKEAKEQASPEIAKQSNESAWTNVDEVTLRARYVGGKVESQTFTCSSILAVPPKYVHDKAADGTIMRSMIDPPTLLIRGINVEAVEALAWTPTQLEFRDATTGEVVERPGELRTSIEPDTVAFVFNP
jgi:pyrimidine deaminase RibD-like protein